jgi:dihydropyrimidinase
MGVTRFEESTRQVLEKIVADGTASFKVFLAYKGAFGIDDAELYRTLELARRLGVIVTAHCETSAMPAPAFQVSWRCRIFPTIRATFSR